MRLIAAAFFAVLMAGSATSPQAVPPHSEARRIVEGAMPLAAELYQEACRTGAGPWARDFSEETFSLLGTLHAPTGRSFHVAFLTTIWGQSGRATNRLLVFSAEGHYLGRYSGLFYPPALEQPATLRFPVSPKIGNEVSFLSGPPALIWVDGDNHSYEPANPSVKGTSCGKPQAAPYVERYALRRKP